MHLTDLRDVPVADVARPKPANTSPDLVSRDPPLSVVILLVPLLPAVGWVGDVSTRRHFECRLGIRSPVVRGRFVPPTT